MLFERLGSALLESCPSQAQGAPYAIGCQRVRAATEGASAPRRSQYTRLYHVSNDLHACGWLVGAAENVEHVDFGGIAGTEVEEEDLIVGMVNAGIHTAFGLGQFARVQFAEEDAVLDVVAEFFEGFEDLGSPLVVGDVVTDQIVSARHGGLLGSAYING